MRYFEIYWKRVSEQKWIEDKGQGMKCLNIHNFQISDKDLSRVNSVVYWKISGKILGDFSSEISGKISCQNLTWDLTPGATENLRNLKISFFTIGNCLLGCFTHRWAPKYMLRRILHNLWIFKNWHTRSPLRSHLIFHGRNHLRPHVPIFKNWKIV